MLPQNRHILYSYNIRDERPTAPMVAIVDEHTYNLTQYPKNEDGKTNKKTFVDKNGNPYPKKAIKKKVLLSPVDTRYMIRQNTIPAVPFTSPTSQDYVPVITNHIEYLRRIKEAKLKGQPLDTTWSKYQAGIIKRIGYWGTEKHEIGNVTSMYSQYFKNVKHQKVNCFYVLAKLGEKVSERMAYTMDWVNYGKASNIDPFQPDLRYKIGQSIIRNMHFDGYLNDYRLGDKKNFNPLRHVYFNMGLGLGESPVLNPPFQWNERDDVRTHSMYTKIGRVYANRIYSNFPMLMIIPGEIKYNNNILKMLGFDGGAAKRQADYIRNGGEKISDKLKDLFQGVGDALSVAMLAVSSMLGGARLIEFKQRYNLYASYLSGLMKELAVALGLINGKGQYIGKWANLHPTMLLTGRLLAHTGVNNGQLFGAVKNASLARVNQTLTYAIGKDVNVSETFSNSTKTNPMVEKMNAQAQDNADDKAGGGMGFMSKTIQGITGILTGNKSAAAPLILNFGTKLAGNISETALIASGVTRMTMPDVWESSSFSRNYTISFKFHSQYGDKLSIFENVFIPFLSLLVLVMARQVGSMSFTEPFSFKMVMPGMFNVNYGIAESLSVKRGEDSNDWTVDNLPKTITCDLSVKDFEPMMVMPLGSRSFMRSLQEFLFPASGISEYLITMSGMSLDEQLDQGKRFRRIIKRYKAGWQDVLEKDITKFYIYNTNPVSNVLSFFLRFSSDVIKSSELRDENYDKFITSTSQLTQSRNNGEINSAASFALNFALDKIRVLKGGSNEGEDPKVTGMKTGEYYENEE